MTTEQTLFTMENTSFMHNNRRKVLVRQTEFCTALYLPELDALLLHSLYVIQLRFLHRHCDFCYPLQHQDLMKRTAYTAEKGSWKNFPPLQLKRMRSEYGYATEMLQTALNIKKSEALETYSSSSSNLPCCCMSWVFFCTATHVPKRTQ